MYFHTNHIALLRARLSIVYQPDYFTDTRRRCCCVSTVEARCREEIGGVFLPALFFMCNMWDEWLWLSARYWSEFSRLLMMMMMRESRYLMNENSKLYTICEKRREKNARAFHHSTLSAPREIQIYVDIWRCVPWVDTEKKNHEQLQFCLYILIITLGARSL